MLSNYSWCHTVEDDDANFTGCPSVVSVGMCWQASPVNTTRTNFCPLVDFQVSRRCTPSGWRPTFKMLIHECLEDIMIKQNTINYINFTGYPLTIVMCGFALIFIAISKKLRQGFHNIIHLNLYLSLMMYAVISLSRSLLLSHVPVLSNVSCLTLRLFNVYLSGSRFTWLCSEGIFMYYSLSNPFSGTTRLKYVVWSVGWGLPGLIATVYVTVVEVVITLEDWASSKCQLPDHYYLTYIVEVPIAIVMVINFGLAGYVLRITWHKLTQLRGTAAAPESSSQGARQQHTGSVISLPEVVSRYSEHVGRLFRRQRRDCVRWARMSKSSIIVSVMMGLHFVPAVLPYEQLDTRSRVRFHFRVVNAVLHAYSGFFIAAVSFSLKPEVRRKLHLSCRKRQDRSENAMNRSRSNRMAKSISLNTLPRNGRDIRRGVSCENVYEPFTM